MIPVQYNLRNLRGRPVTSGLTILGIALVVACFVALMAMAHGLNRTLVIVGRPDGVVVLRKGALAEAASSIAIDEFKVVRDLPQLVRNSANDVLLSPELVVQVIREKKTGAETAVTLRGVRPVAFQVHDMVKIVAGHPLKPRAGQLLVGRGIRERYRGLALGETVRLFDRSWTITGVLDAGGGPFESEIWCDLDDLMSDTHRAYFSALYGRLVSLDHQGSFDASINEDPRLGLEARAELEYYDEQSESARRMRWSGLVVATIMAVGAIFAAMNTMYGAIAARTRDIATLRALGFTRLAVMTSFVYESLILGLGGGLLGCLLALPVHGASTEMINSRSAADIGFVMEVSPGILGAGLVFGLLIGLAGGLLPAWVGGTTPIVRALREV
jgi:putative ABC transport system permease protein